MKRGAQANSSRLLALTVVAALFAVACGGASAGDAADVSLPAEASGATEPEGGATVETDPLFVRTSDGADASSAEAPTDVSTAAPASSDASVEPSESSPATTIPIVPDTGVPGIESDDLFCRSWSEFAGSFRALGLVSAIGDADDALRLEVIAAPAVIAAVDGLDQHLPAELETERQLILDEFVGPFFRRATTASNELAAADVGDTAGLGQAWLDELTIVGVDDPNITMTLPASANDEPLAAAVAAFAASVPSIVQDPSLITDVAIPLTDRYLETICPDQGTLGGNDVINR